MQPKINISWALGDKISEKIYKTHTPRSDQPVVGLPHLRVSCDKWLRNPMRLGYTNNDVSLGN